MKHAKNNRAVLLACFALAVAPAINVGAQAITAADLDLPDSRPAYTPQSGISEATMGIMSADVDHFMSVFDFKTMGASKLFGYVGLAETLTGTLGGGLNGGFAANLGKVYLGIAYGGSAIGELIRLIPDQKLVGSISTNNVGVLVGTGPVGIKLGFSEFIQGEGDVREISLKPTLEVGAAVKAGPVTIKPAIRGGLNIHQYRFTQTDGATVTKLKEDFLEPSAGITLGFNFSKGERTQLALDLVADGSMRLYDAGDGTGLSSTATTGDKTSLIEGKDVQDYRITGSPAFTFRRELNDRFTLGIKAKAGIDFHIAKIPQTGVVSPEENYAVTGTNFVVTPDISAGLRVKLFPDRFAINGGIGIPLLTYSHRETKMNGPVTVEEEMVWVPSFRFAVGVDVNFTQNTALELVASADVDSRRLDTLPTTKFAALFTIKK